MRVGYRQGFAQQPLDCHGNNFIFSGKLQEIKPLAINDGVLHCYKFMPL